MEQESLDKAKKVIIEKLATVDMPLQDRVELMMVILNFLNDYDENREVLQKHKTLKKQL